MKEEKDKFKRAAAAFLKGIDDGCPFCKDSERRLKEVVLYFAKIINNVL